jgi:hypothetical protein
MLERNRLSDLSYNTFWGESERDNLLPPLDVSFRSKGDQTLLPFKIFVDEKALTDFVFQEGVNDGRAVDFLLDYSGEEYFRLISGEYLFHPSKYCNLLFKLPQEDHRYGYHIVQDGKHLIATNIAQIYFKSLIRSALPSLDEHQSFIVSFSDILAHEIGHARQPDSFKKRPSLNEVRAFFVASLIGIDLIRRSRYPWMGLVETGVTVSELLLATLLTDIYRRSPLAERFAREYAKHTSKIIEKMITIE